MKRKWVKNCSAEWHISYGQMPLDGPVFEAMVDRAEKWVASFDATTDTPTDSRDYVAAVLRAALTPEKPA
jgi:hypothetical protein